MAKMFENIIKRDKGTIIRHIKALEEKYGEELLTDFTRSKKRKNGQPKESRNLKMN